MYTIGQLSRKTNLSIRTLRYYDEIGLLKPAKVAESGYRYYADKEIRVLRHITALKELGFTLSSIRELLSGGEDEREDRWRAFLDFELATVAEEKRRLDEMERLLLTTRHAFEMKGQVEAEDIFMFIRALRAPSEASDRFLAQHFTEREIGIIRNLPNLSDKDPRSMEWAKLIREVKSNLHEPPSSAVSQQLAARIVEASMEWFQHDEELIDKYWSLIRPESGKETKVFGMDAEVMDHIDRIVDWYLLHEGEGKAHGG